MILKDFGLLSLSGFRDIMFFFITCCFMIRFYIKSFNLAINSSSWPNRCRIDPAAVYS